MTTAITVHDHRRTTGGLFVAGALAFAGAATVLSSTFDWPDILREPTDVVLPAFVAGGTSLVWTWFATAWTYAILLVPILLLPAARPLPRPGAECGDVRRSDLGGAVAHRVPAVGLRGSAVGRLVRRW
jgi:hypothetical protein